MSKEYNAEMHTAEHILNAVMTEMKGIRAFSNHIEKKKSKCDYRLDIPLTAEELDFIEKRVNEVIESSLPVTAFDLSTEDAAARFDLTGLPDSAQGSIRIVKIGEFNEYPCIGVHVENTGSIGRFAIASYDHSDGVFRIRFRLEQMG